MARWRCCMWVFSCFALVVVALAGQQSAQQPGGPQAKVTNPHGALAVPCQECHTYTSWKPIRSNPEFNHDQTGYSLRGMHQKVECTQCHTSLIFKNVSTRCSDCHADIHRRQFGTACENCHSVKGWQISLNQIRDHQNRFPLVGAHAMLQCVDCHKNAAAGQYIGLQTTCISCHQQDFHTQTLDHVSAGFSTACETCHTVDTWFNAKFDHLKNTGYALTGAHTTLACTACHVNNMFKGTSASCYTCHTADFNKTTNPNHATAGFPTDCASCHTTAAWVPATFNHASVFPLTGAHATVACAQCHVNNNYSTLPRNCYGCHQPDFNKTTSPNHVASGFPTDCAVCHTTTAWVPSSFNHGNTAFPLTGAHTTVACAQCHVNNNYTSLPTNCIGCHRTDWNGTANPNHAAAAFPTTCETCHNTSNWTGVNFNHAQYANYPLTGAHATLTCVQCHVNNNYTSMPTGCYACHQKEFNGATSPNHVASGFPTDCSICHTTTGWIPSSFNHNNTAFPLTGAHTTVVCSQCHVNNNYTTLPTNCYGCHQSDWNGTNDPAHAAAGFPTTCNTCHTTTSWAGAVFNHNNTPFPLTGAHVNVDCVKCHVNNVFAGTPTACYACHQADFTGTTNPNHVTAGWPTTCTTCHTTTAWLPATLPASYHTFFPISHGNANGVCATCHTNSSDYSVFTCTNCHAATTTNNQHRGISGYVYNSVNCYACHKNGRT